MIKGRSGDTSGRPYIEGRIHLPRLNIAGDISFLMDTGADSSMLMPGDAKRLGVSYGLLRGDRACSGIGGAVHCFVERAVLVFSDPNIALYAYDIEIDIMQDDFDMEDVPSLLGRDIIDRWRITYDPQGIGLRAKIHSADMMFDLKAAGGKSDTGP